MFEEIKKELEKSPKARERQNKNRFLAWFLYKKWHLDGRTPDIKMLELIFVDYASYDRAWRQVLEKNPHLRGKDYDEKEALMKDKQLELGYNV